MSGEDVELSHPVHSKLGLAYAGGQLARLPHTRWFTWAQKGGLAILDQGLFAGTNFIISILLARWLDPVQYGAFATAYSIFLLLATFHTAILTEPMLIFGPGKFVDVFRRYIWLLLWGHAGVTLLISVVLAIVAGILHLTGQGALAQALAGLAIATPGILVLWILRRAFYVTHQVHWAVSGGALYLGLMLAGIYGIYRLNSLTSFSALVMMGVAGIVVGAWLTYVLHPQRQPDEQSPTPQTVIGTHWDYGKWASATAALTWLPGNIYFVLLPVLGGLEDSAGLKAIMNLIMPILQVNSALGILIVPVYVRVLHSYGQMELTKWVKRGVVFFSAGAGTYWVVLYLFRSQLFDVLYGGRYRDYADLLLPLGAIPVAAGLNIAFGGALRALERPDLIFRCYVVATAAALTIGVWLIGTHGSTGAVLGTLISSLVTALSLGWFYLKSGYEAVAL